MRRYAWLFCAASLLLPSTSALADWEWVGGTSLNWFDVDNWDQDGQPALFVPGCDIAGATVLIKGADGPVLVKCESAIVMTLGSFDTVSPVDIASELTLTGPSSITGMRTLQFAGIFANAPLTLFGDNEWTIGPLDGTSEITNTGQFTLGGTNDRDLRANFDNEGTVLQNVDVTLLNGDGGDAVVTSTGTWRGQKGVGQFGTTFSAFNLSGGSIIGDGPDALRFTLPLNATGGTIHAESGDVRISGGGDHSGTGTYQADAGQSVIFDTFSESAAVFISGPWTAQGAGEARVDTALNVIEDGTFTTSLINAPGFTLNGDLGLAGGGFTNTGAMTWTNGAIVAAGGLPQTATNTGVIVIQGLNSVPTISENVTLTNSGVWRQFSDARIDGFLTLDGGTIELINNKLFGAICAKTGAGIDTTERGGVLIRPSGAQGTRSEVLACGFVENMVIRCEAGELRFLSDFWGAESTSFEVAGDALMTLRSGDYELEGCTFAGAGTIILQSGSCMEISAGADDEPTVNLLDDGSWFQLGAPSAGASLFASGIDEIDFINQGEFRFTAGDITFDAPSRFLNEGVFRTTAGGNDIGGRFESTGAVVFDHAVQIESTVNGNPDVDITGGTLDQNNVTVSILAGEAGASGGGEWRLNNVANINGAGTFVLENGGVLRKTGPLTTATISSQFEARPAGQNVVAVDAGELAFTNFPKGAGEIDWRITQGSKVRLVGQTYESGQNPDESIVGDLQGVIALADGEPLPARFECDELRNGGRIQSPAEDAVAEIVIEADLTLLPNGIVSVNLAGPAPEESDRLTIEGAAALGGLLRINLIDGFEPNVGDSFIIVAATDAMTGAFDQIIGDGQWSAAIVDHELVVTLDAAPTCDADISGDGVVGAADLAALLAAWGFAPSALEDLDGDDIVGPADLAALLASWGTCE